MKLKLNFKTKAETTEALELIKSLQQNVSKLPLQRPPPSEPQTKTVSNVEQDASQVFMMMSTEVFSDFILLTTNKDWDLMLKGAKSATYRKDEVVIAAGESYQRLYQISKGHCRVEIKLSGQTQVVGLMGQGETFGENSLLVKTTTKGD